MRFASSDVASFAPTSPRRSEHEHEHEHEHIQQLLIEDAKRGLVDIVAGRTVEADRAIDQLQQRRSNAKSAAS